MSNRRVLFLCTGNYYRSRFAEEWFNHLAGRRELRWIADSSGLNVAYGNTVNSGPISSHTVDAMKSRGLATAKQWRFPKQASETEFADSHLVVAVNRREHRPLMVELFPHWADKIEYWQIDDLDFADPATALPQVQQHVDQLIERLLQAPQIIAARV